MSTLEKLINRKYELTKMILSKSFEGKSQKDIQAELAKVDAEISKARKKGNRDYSEETVSHKYNLTRTILAKKNLDNSAQTDVKTSLAVLNSLRKALKENKALECEEQLTGIEECVARVR